MRQNSVYGFFVILSLSCYILPLSTERIITSSTKRQNKFKLDGHGRARREAARRRKSERKIIFRKTWIPLAVMEDRMKKFSENTSTIPEVMDSSTLHFKANFKFSRFFWGERWEGG